MIRDDEDALAAVAREAFDMILIDINMPVVDGLTATRLLRSEPGPNRTTPVIVLSAASAELRIIRSASPRARTPTLTGPSTSPPFRRCLLSGHWDCAGLMPTPKRSSREAEKAPRQGQGHDRADAMQTAVITRAR